MNLGIFKNNSNKVEEPEVFHIYVTRFNEAVSLYEQKKLKEALEKFNRIFDPISELSNEKKVITPQFLAQIEINKTTILIDLEKFDEAKSLFNMATLKWPYNEWKLYDNQLYEYNYNLWIILMNLWNLDNADDYLNKAIEIILNKFYDMKKYSNLRESVIKISKNKQMWTYIEKKLENSKSILDSIIDEKIKNYLWFEIMDALYLAKEWLWKSEEAKWLAKTILDNAEKLWMPHIKKKWIKIIEWTYNSTLNFDKSSDKDIDTIKIN